MQGHFFWSVLPLAGMISQELFNQSLREKRAIAATKKDGLRKGPYGSHQREAYVHPERLKQGHTVIGTMLDVAKVQEILGCTRQNTYTKKYNRIQYVGDQCPVSLQEALTVARMGHGVYCWQPPYLYSYQSPKGDN